MYPFGDLPGNLAAFCGVLRREYGFRLGPGEIKKVGTRSSRPPPRYRITMNRDRLISDAKARVIELAPDYTPMAPRTIRALGSEALGNLSYGIWAMREGNHITDHEVTIGRKIAYVLCGGDGPPRVVTEQDILDLEREAFLALLGTRETRARIVHMLEHGKPLRN